MKDVLTEMTYGEGAIRVYGKIVLLPKGILNTDSRELHRTLVGGMLINPSDPLVRKESGDLHEMWECEFIIIPKKKYAPHDKNGKRVYQFAGYDLGGILTSGFAEPENWGDEYFGKKEPATPGRHERS